MMEQIRHFAFNWAPLSPKPISDHTEGLLLYKAEAWENLGIKDILK